MHSSCGGKDPGSAQDGQHIATKTNSRTIRLGQRNFLYCVLFGTLHNRNIRAQTPANKVRGSLK
jgi:hypothetical protein